MTDFIMRIPFEIMRIPFEIMRIPFEIIRIPFEIMRIPFEIMRIPFELLFKNLESQSLFKKSLITIDYRVAKTHRIP